MHFTMYFSYKGRGLLIQRESDLRLKDYSLCQPLSDEIVFGDEDKLLTFVVEEFKSVKNYNRWLNDSIENL